MSGLGIARILIALLVAAIPAGLVAAIAAKRGPELFARAFAGWQDAPRPQGVQEQDLAPFRLGGRSATDDTSPRDAGIDPGLGVPVSRIDATTTFRG